MLRSRASDPARQSSGPSDCAWPWASRTRLGCWLCSKIPACRSPDAAARSRVSARASASCVRRSDRPIRSTPSSAARVDRQVARPDRARVVPALRVGHPVSLPDRAARWAASAVRIPQQPPTAPYQFARSAGSRWGRGPKWASAEEVWRNHVVPLRGVSEGRATRARVGLVRDRRAISDDSHPILVPASRSKHENADARRRSRPRSASRPLLGGGELCRD